MILDWTSCTYFEDDSSDSPATLRHKYRTSIHRICLNCQNFTLQLDWVSICVLRLQVFSLLIVQRSPEPGLARERDGWGDKRGLKEFVPGHIAV